MLVATEASDPFGFKSYRVGKVRSIQEWVCSHAGAWENTSLVSSWDSRGDGVSEVSFSLSLETSGGAVAPVGKAAGEGSEETSSFLVGLLKHHAVIVALNLNWLGIVAVGKLLLLDWHLLHLLHWLLLNIGGCNGLLLNI